MIFYINFVIALARPTINLENFARFIFQDQCLFQTTIRLSLQKRILFKASIYQPDVESPNLVASGPLAGITRLQQLSGKSANEVLEAFNRLNLKQKKEFEYPDSSWCTSARKKSQDLTDVDIVKKLRNFQGLNYGQLTLVC